MDPQNLVGMANQIGSFFGAMPDRIEARDGVATHIRKFREPRMRRQNLAALDPAQGAELGALVSEALRHPRTLLQPPAWRNPQREPGKAIGTSANYSTSE